MYLSRLNGSKALVDEDDSSKHGALISCRPVPALRFEPRNMQVISTEEDAIAESRNESFIGMIYDDKDSGKRLLETSYGKRKSGRFLGCVKKVMGGAFFGHDDLHTAGEHEIVARFLEAMTACPARMNMSISDPVRHHRALLQRSVDLLLETIRKVFAEEVDFYLTHFANVLANLRNPLKWSLRSNNCQGFYTMLLRNLPIDRAFYCDSQESFTNQGQMTKVYRHSPRYCLSFGFDIDAPAGQLEHPQIRSIIWNFYRLKRDYCDIIEFSEEFRVKSRAYPIVPWEIIDVAPENSTAHDTLVDALWALPRDSASILQTHLRRNSSRYSTKEGTAISESEWYENRLRVFHQLDVFTSLCSGFLRAVREQVIERALFSKVSFLDAKQFGTLYASETKIMYPGAMYRISGRQRDVIKRDLKHNVGKLLAKVGMKKDQV